MIRSVRSDRPIYLQWIAVFRAFPDLAEAKPEKEEELTVAANVRAYLANRSSYAFVAFCCLFFTVLSDHHPLSTAYFAHRGVATSAKDIPIRAVLVPIPIYRYTGNPDFGRSALGCIEANFCG